MGDIGIFGVFLGHGLVSWEEYHCIFRLDVYIVAGKDCASIELRM